MKIRIDIRVDVYYIDVYYFGGSFGCDEIECRDPSRYRIPRSSNLNWFGTLLKI